MDEHPLLHIPIHEDPNLPPNTIRLETPSGSQAIFYGVTIEGTSGHELWTNSITAEVAATAHVTRHIDAPQNINFSVDPAFPATVPMKMYNDLSALWAEERDENARLRAEIARLLAQVEATLRVVQEVAEEDPYTYNDNNGKMECAFCYDTWGWGAHEKHTKDHDPDCLITRARNLVQQIQPKEQE